MARFYGWNDEYLEQMDAHTFREYLDCISVIEAQEALVQLTVADYPRQGEEFRNNVHRSLHITAYPNRKKMSIEEALNKLGRGR
jgi:hypothetical protein